MERKDIIAILLAARPYIAFDGTKLLSLAASGDTLAQAVVLAASANLKLEEALIVIVLGDAQETGVIINPTWLKRTVVSIKHHISSSGNPTWRCTLDDGNALYIRQSNKDVWIDAGYTALGQMRLQDEWPAQITVYVTPGEKGFIDCQHVIPGGELTKPAVDEGIQRRAEVIDIANEWVYRGDDYYFLDTETTGTGDDDEVIEIAIIDTYGETILNARVYPTVSISTKAQATHGISLEDLDGKPLIDTLTIQDQPLADWLIGHYDRIVTYHAEFDARLINQSFTARGFEPMPFKFNCAMKLYAKFNGEKHDKTGDWKYVSLADACKKMDVVDEPKHSALSDALAAEALVFALADFSENEPF